MTTFSTSAPTTSPQPEANPDQEPRFGTNLGDRLEEQMPAAPDLSTSLPSLPMSAELSDREPRAGSRCNVGRAEQKVRLIAGTALLAAAAFAPVSRGWRIGLAAFGVAEILTGSIRYCPVSQLLGVNTCRDEE
ncbi:MAG TPA: DUF2892 domain-containing protein [Candidatus Synoicihabitans sp.]|nr:DUF2892 domain-containing protein [Candidatus Synoicihabitans sp.]